MAGLRDGNLRSASALVRQPKSDPTIPNFERRSGVLPGFATLGLIWVATSDLATKVSIGPITLSGLATLLTAIATLLFSPTVALRQFLPRAPSTLISPADSRSIVPLPLVLFLTFAIGGLAFHFTGEGVQNVAVYVAFAGAIAFSATRLTMNSVERLRKGFVYVGLLAGVVGCVEFSLGWTLQGNRSFALAALVLVAILIPARASTNVQALAPLILVVAIGASQSRTALAVAALLLAFVWLRNPDLEARLRIATTLILMLLALIGAFIFIPELRERFLVGDNALTLNGIPISTSGRVQLWETTFSSAMTHPWFGQGAGSASALINERYPGIGHPHNDYLRIWHDFGVAGLGAWVAGVALLILGALKRARRASSDYKGVHYGAALSLIAVSTAAVTDNVLVYPFVMVPCGVIVGASIALRCEVQR